MKVLLAGIQRIKGKSKKAPHNDYDFSRLLVLQKINPRSGTDYEVQGGGYEVQEMACEPSAISQFLGLQFPCQVEVETEARPGKGGFEVWVVGVKQKAAA